MMFGPGKGGATPGMSAGGSSPPSGGNMLSALANSPIAQRLSGNTPSAPEMAGNSFDEPGILGLVQAQGNYWRDRREANDKGIHYADLLANLTKATAPPQLPSLPFTDARSSQPSLQEILAQLTSRNRYGSGR